MFFIKYGITCVVCLYAQHSSTVMMWYASHNVYKWFSYVEMIEPNIRSVTTVSDSESWQTDNVKTQCCSTETNQWECAVSTPVVLKFLLIDPIKHRFIFQFWLYGWVVGSNSISPASLLLFSCRSVECTAWLESKFAFGMENDFFLGFYLRALP